jgi:hypothetical protein
MSYKRGIPYVYTSQSEEEEKNNNMTVHFWGEYDESYKNTGWSENYRDKFIDLSGIKITLKDLDEIVIQRLEEIIKYEHDTDKYKKIEKIFNENKKLKS